MASTHPTPAPNAARAAVFISYAREDTDAAKRVTDALRAAGVEVWFDQDELRGGDTWDAKIRTQIRTCTLFLPVISQQTEARTEGYFRREWLMAADRTRDMAQGRAFIVPVVIDDTPESGAAVPEEFLRYQWTRVAQGSATPEFVEQIRRLLEAPHRMAAGSRVKESVSRQAPPTRRGLGWGWAVTAAAALVGVLFLVRRPVEKPAAPAAAAPEKVATPVIPESKRLVAEARKLWEPWDFATRDDFIRAEQILKRAIELDPADAEAWASQAIVSCGLLVYNYDNSPARRLSALKHADGAFKLAPDQNLPRFARAFSLRFQAATREESIRLLREAAAREPGNKFVVRTLGSSLRVVGNYAEALVYLEKAAALPGGDPIAHYNRSMVLALLKRTDEAEAAIEQALALAPNYSNALRQKLGYRLNFHGDLAGARALLEEKASVILQDDRGAAIASEVWLLLRETEKCIAVLETAQNYIESSFFTGPKAYRVGLAHRMAGRAAAAEAQWRSALKVVDDRLAAKSDAVTELGWKALLLAVLGQRAEAERIGRTYDELRSVPPGTITYSSVAAYVALGRHDETIDFLARFTREAEEGNGIFRWWRLTWIKRNPELDALREHPRFQQLLRSLPEEKTK